MSYMIAPEFRRNSRPASESESEAKMKCSLFDRCKGCPYPRHGFVCWGRDGQCIVQSLPCFSLTVTLPEITDRAGKECLP